MRRCAFAGFLFFFLSLPLFPLSESSGNPPDSAGLDLKIAELQKKIAVQTGTVRNKTFEDLIRCHKKRIRLDAEDEAAKWALIEDDLKYGKGGYAIHLLEILKDNRSKIRLIQLNADPLLQGIRIKVRPFTRPFYRYFFSRFIYPRRKYEFSFSKIPFLAQGLDREGLTSKEKDLVCQWVPGFSGGEETLPQGKGEEITVETVKAEPSTIPVLNESDEPEPSVPAFSADELESRKKEAEQLAALEVENLKKEAAKVSEQLVEEKEKNVEEKSISEAGLPSAN
ncbi:MAG: hypothetical protein JW774_11685 [Candidatus Aureabacteria bacterium]|nr:hypothetical protein [Candidatus Auribacterota bacterium]